MNPLYIGFPAFLTGSIISYAIREYMMGKLSAEQIGAISLAQRRYRLRLLLTCGVLTIFVLAMRMITGGGLGRPAFYAFLASLVVVYVWFNVRTYKAAVNLLSNSHRRLLLAALAAGFAGFAALVASMAAT
ncbi:hypothetical protein [Pseudorhodoferax sp.]|uniref:hypothetical protein n=1 Tax=Pseudorhodoferax sp. TaxID=1993553 RepID=UPI002DD6378D|nr:hypothetical protein [Pseudorhodoferax sp.]